MTQTQPIQTTPGLRGGQPHVNGTRITVADIAIMHLKLGQTVAEIAGEYDLSLAAVYAALAYYFEHQSTIDARMAEDDAFVTAFRKQNPSLLRERLKQLQHA